MNLAMSLERLPDSIRRLIVADPTITARYDQGEKLEEILSSREWAADWLRSNRGLPTTQVLRTILIGFASLPFELESALKLITEKTELTGAETRIAVVRLRRAGIVFAVRKAWGDQLLYIPTDNITLWQSFLLPVDGEPLKETDSDEISYCPTAFRLPLSLELLSVWQEIQRQPIAWTNKSPISRSIVNRLTDEMRLTSDELVCLSLVYPQQDRMPPQVALALDLGIHIKALKNEGNVIRISDSGIADWLTHLPESADRELLARIVIRYVSASPVMHLTFSALLTLMDSNWYPDNRLTILDGNEGAINDVLNLMQSFGWLERGDLRGQAVFRSKLRIGDYSNGKNQDIQDAGQWFVQPDGEILVPPETSLRQRWDLAEIAERVTADAIFVYRLTRSYCFQAFNAGHSEQSMIAFLENGSGAPLPESVTRSIGDWFAPLGKIRFQETVLLRMENSSVAAALLQDPDTAEMLGERISERDFVVMPSALKKLRSRLHQIGYPPSERRQTETGSPEGAESVAKKEGDTEGYTEPGWIYGRQRLSAFEADRSLPAVEELFPGMSSIPEAWLTKPRTYHSTTRKELIRRAIDWQASIQVERDGIVQTLVPKDIREDGARWEVVGEWRVIPNSSDFAPDDRRRSRQATVVGSEEIAEVMIMLPSLEELETH
ncbi:helicase-associated domain-containing protein [Cohnella herbarum]|uniref:Helicase XPB/Ssl2 N-terminal domain-containing protein n=1 Tax=Cohnella herbarum TaxID=2728023 RepID=A0A7Z2VIF9_9BACL|nr:helicase-associated domain-containing protein [Cohnella herbarum]QJD83490.1 hypothetical protein HH215_10050 [Cohnella herbarum]